MKFTSIRQKASLVILAISLVAIFMIAIGWQAMRVSEASLSEFEAETLPEISTALTLAEGVAQLAAIAPYTAGSGRPFQLQTESRRIRRRIVELREVADNLIDIHFRQDIEKRLDDLQLTLEELVSRVQEELYLREDSLAQQFHIRRLPPLQQDIYTINTEQGLMWLLELLNDPSDMPAQITDILNLNQQNESVRHIANELLLANKQLNHIQERKVYLLISIRAKSEQLSDKVSVFVGGLQKKVSRQRQEVSGSVAYGQNWIIGISIFLLFGLGHLYFYSQRMTRDLQSVTENMERLSLGRTDLRSFSVKRNDEIGTLIHMFEVFRRDAIRRLELTAELSDHKKLLEAIFNNMNDGLSVFSGKGELLTWNRHYQELFDIRDEEISIGMPIEAVQSLINRGEHKNLSLENQAIKMEDINASRQYQFQNFERHFATGKIIEFRSRPMPEGGFVTLYTDLTERKSIEQQLRKAQKMELLGQLTGGLAHDFNNLLAAIMGNLQMLSESSPLTDNQTRYIQRALTVSEKSSNLVQRLLAFSRRQQLFPEATCIDDLIEGMLDLVEYSVGSDIVIDYDLHCPERLSLIDPSQLENALLNLSLNSAAAMPDGGRLAFSTMLSQLPESDTSAICITVEDSGKGIPKDLLGRIFEPFFTTKPVGKGSGLGLSMVYGFVKQSGGEIQVDSLENNWTKVCIYLPLSVHSQELPRPTDNHHLDRIRLAKNDVVWLVEDDSEVQYVIREQLEQLGLVVSCFETAEVVLEKIEHAMPNLLISDVNLAGTISGVELAHSIANDHPEYTGVIALMSGLPKEELTQQYQLKSTDIFLSKPFIFDQFLNIFHIQ